MPIQIQNYMSRINYTGPANVSIETLKKLHRQHVLSIPFENLDVHLGRPILLDEESLNKKLLVESRGGYCYEMNGLFALCLIKLGFKVTYLTARVTYMNSTPIPRMHMLLLVEVFGSSWICDVGFSGNGLLDPIPLIPGIYEQYISKSLFEEFQLSFSCEDRQYELLSKIQGKPESLYKFTLEPYLPVDFEPFSFYHSNSSKSLFTNKVLCIISTLEGRKILNGMD